MKRLLSCLSLLGCLSATSLAAVEDPPELVDFTIDDSGLLEALEDLASDHDRGLVIFDEANDLLAAKAQPIDVDEHNWLDIRDLLEVEYGVAVRFRDGRIVVRDANRRFLEATRVRTLRTRVITAGSASYVGRKLGIPEPHENQHGRRGVIDMYDHDGPFEGDVMDLVLTEFDDDTWQREGVAIDEFNTDLIITHLPERLDAIQAFVTELEASVARSITVRVYPLDAFPPQSLLTREEVAAIQHPPVMSSVTAENTRYGSGSVDELPFIVDYDVVGDSDDPILSVALSGLQVETVASMSGRYIRLDIAATSAHNLQPRGVPITRGSHQNTITLQQEQFSESGGTHMIPDGGAVVIRLGKAIYAVSATSNRSNPAD